MRVGGWDVGQLQDPSVLTTMYSARGVDADAWVIDGIYQLPLGMPFSAQLRALQPHFDTLDHLAFDSGGVGQSLGEHIHGKRLQSLVPVVITGGTSKGRIVGERVAVGKTALIQGLLQQIFHRELRVQPDAPGRDILRAEMAAFQYLWNGRFRKMEAASDRHDDAVLATALSAFIARRLVIAT